MSNKGLVALACLLAALCFGYWYLGHSEKAAEHRAFMAKRLFDTEAGDIAVIKIAQRDAKPTVGRRTGEQDWVITAPYELAPNPVLWNRIAQTLSTVLNERTIEPSPQDMARYGLEEPALVVTAATEAGSELRLSFGELEPTQTRRYAFTNDHGVFLVANETFRQLDCSLDFLRYPFPYSMDLLEAGIYHAEFARIFGGTAQDKAAVAEGVPLPAVGTESQVLEFARTEDGPWRMLAPVDAVADL